MSDYLTTSAGDRVGYDGRGSGPALIFVTTSVPHEEPVIVGQLVASRHVAESTPPLDLRGGPFRTLLPLREIRSPVLQFVIRFSMPSRMRSIP